MINVRKVDVSENTFQNKHFVSASCRFGSWWCAVVLLDEWQKNVENYGVQMLCFELSGEHIYRREEANIDVSCVPVKAG